MTVSASAELSEPIERVWSLVSDFAGLQRWHPAVQSCEVAGQGVGAVRTVRFADWWAAERLDVLDEASHVIGYSVVDSSRPEVIGVAGTIRLAALAGGGTRIDWTSGHQPDHPHATAVNAGLQSYYPARIDQLRDALAQIG